MIDFSVASYNVHRCIGNDGVRDPERIGRVLGELRCDVIGLQEVTSPLDGEPEFCQMAHLAHAAGYHAIYGPTMERYGGHYGNLLLVRRPVLDVRRIDLTVHNFEPRGALDTDVDFDGQAVRIVVTHLGLLPGERRIQVRRLLEAVAAHETAELVVLLGDINEWFIKGRPLRWLHRHFGYAPAARSYPATLPLFALDRIWVHPRSALRGFRAHRSPTARVASDHLPVSARVVWTGAEAAAGTDAEIADRDPETTRP